MKTCSKCRQDKPLSAFGTNGRKGDRARLKSHCRPCDVARAVSYRKRSGGKSDKKYALKKKYGLTERGFLFLLTVQGGKCAICRRRFAGSGRKGPYVDHCHASGKVRGLLCNACNRALGLMGDSAITLESAARYLWLGRLK